MDRWTTDNEPGRLRSDELLDLIRRPDWWPRAACLGVGVDLFVGDKGSDRSPGLAYCARCPVTEECARWADGYPGSVGIWGGDSGRTRRGRRSAARECRICGGPVTEARRIVICSSACEAVARRQSWKAHETRRGVAK